MEPLILPPEGVRRVPVLIWSRLAPKGAIEQLRRIAAQPYVVERVAAMPDVHVASGVAVGTVFATERHIVPAALGGDLGCGVAAVRFNCPAATLDRKSLQSIVRSLSDRVPLGDRTHRGRGVQVPEALFAKELSTRALERTRERLVPRHLGTLGGGNHFIELDRDGGGDLWVLVHSGSRGLGAAVAAHHLRAAEVADASELPALRTDEAAGAACLSDIEWALAFARANRTALMTAATAIIAEFVGVGPDSASAIDVHHNFVRREHHFGRELLVHRKGAISAAVGEQVVIPGSMGTASYIVEGLGNDASFRSASHGAGRVLTRTEARRELSVQSFTASMRKVVYDERRARAMIDEAPAAYRDIGEVLDDEAELVRPVVRLEPIAVIKG